eukprot:1121190-Rhodomonas_salina.1
MKVSKAAENDSTESKNGSSVIHSSTAHINSSTASINSSGSSMKGGSAYSRASPSSEYCPWPPTCSPYSLCQGPRGLGSRV